MLGLFATLNVGQRALLANQQAIEVAGHNIANINNPAYTRQRVMLQTSSPIQTAGGSVGSGVTVSQVTSVRDQILESEIISESSTTGSLTAQQDAMQTAQSALGEQLDASGSPTAGVSARLSSFFNSWQSLSADPSNLSARQTVIQNSASLANEFRAVDKRLGDLQSNLNTQLSQGVDSANKLLQDIARLNREIEGAESGSSGQANDLRDTRQQKLQELGGLVNFDMSTGISGGVNVSVGGVTLVNETAVSDRLQVYDPGSGMYGLRAEAAGTTLSPSSGKLAGTISVRDGAIADLRSSINTLASNLITQVNALHTPGFALDGSSSTPFFTGTTSGDIQVNSVLTSDPTRLQAAGTSGNAGDNQVARSVASLASETQAALGGITFSQRYSATVNGIGASLSGVNQSLADQKSVTDLLSSQRSSLSGVSMDEELADLTRYQKAYEASARVMSTVATMLDTVINLGR